jgi:hypothetical protein
MPLLRLYLRFRTFSSLVPQALAIWGTVKRRAAIMRSSLADTSGLSGTVMAEQSPS